MIDTTIGIVSTNISEDSVKELGREADKDAVAIIKATFRDPRGREQ